MNRNSEIHQKFSSPWSLKKFLMIIDFHVLQTKSNLTNYYFLLKTKFTYKWKSEVICFSSNVKVVTESKEWVNYSKNSLSRSSRNVWQ